MNADIRTYGVVEAVAARARFYAATFVLQEALFGAEHGAAEAFAALSAYQ